MNADGTVAVCYHPEWAVALVAAGVHVVLCGPEPAAAGAGSRHGPGRVAYFAIAPTDAPEQVEEQAIVMARELFGAEPTVVRDQPGAMALLGDLAKPPEWRSGTVGSLP